MGKRDIGQRETKKPKKDAKRVITTSILPPTVAPPVEVVGKHKKKRDEDFE
jgi:hypothetical protein